METEKPARKPRARSRGTKSRGEGEVQPPARRARSRKRVAPEGTDSPGHEVQPPARRARSRRRVASEGTDSTGHEVEPQTAEGNPAIAGAAAKPGVDAATPDGSRESGDQPEAGISPNGPPSTADPSTAVAQPARDQATSGSLDPARSSHEAPDEGASGTAGPNGPSVIPFDRRAADAAPGADGGTKAGGGTGFKQRSLAAARMRFANDRTRSALDERQIDRLLNLLHEPGQDRSLVSSTYGYLARGMSHAHAEVQIKKLRGEFREDRRAA